MKKQTWEVLLTVFLAEGLLLLCAVFFPGRESFVKIPGIAEIFHQNAVEDNNQEVEKTIAALLDYERDSLIKTEKRVLESSIQKMSSKKDTATRASSTVANTSLPDSSLTILNPAKDGKYALDAVFDALYKLNFDTAAFVRMLHFGDSQIEGDRISSDFRKSLQREFGGMGTGYFPLTDVTNHLSASGEYIGNLKSYDVVHKRTGNGFYGYSGRLFRFNATQPADSLSKAAPPQYKLKFHQKVSYEKICLLYGKLKTKALVKYEFNGTTVTDTLFPAEFGVSTVQVQGSPKQVKITFFSGNPDLYGLLIDGNRGIQVDNLGIRGHAGNYLVNIDQQFLAKQFQFLNPKLIIFQFGANVVQYANPSSKWVEDYYDRTLKKLKEAAPGASIIVVGVNDIAHKVGNSFESFSSVETIRDAQKRAALKADCAFWDLYEIMGGKNSILTWAKSKNPLACADYAHFNPRGQQLVAKLLYKSFINEYMIYLERKGKQLSL